MAEQGKWWLEGDYFENCNCTAVCPCLFSADPPLRGAPTEDVCDVALAFHIARGRYGETLLDDLNFVLAAHTPGPMAAGNWTAAPYIDARADTAQTEALGTIFSGAAGGPMAAFAPLVATHLPARKVEIRYTIEGRTRSAEIPGVMHMAVEPLATLHASGEMWVAAGHPVAPDRLALAKGRPGSHFADHGMRWDNSGRNGHYAPIRWAA